MKMNGDTFGFTILPDQMAVANPILILMLIPLFDKVIYPVLGEASMSDCVVPRSHAQARLASCEPPCRELSLVVSCVRRLSWCRGWWSYNLGQ